jgi:hypothetical protein
MNHGRKFVVSFLLLSILMLPRLAAAQAKQPAILQIQNNGTTAGTAANFFKLNFTTGCSTTFSSGVFSIACTGGAGNPGGSANQIQYNNAGTSFAGLTMTGDCTIVVATGAITCTGTSGTAFGPFATVTGLTGVIYGNGSSAPTVASTTQFGTALNAYLATLTGCGTASYVFVPATPNCVAQSGGAYTFDSPIVNTSGTVSLQNSTPANITALTGTDTLIPTNSGAFTTGHSVVGDANGGIADSGSANVTAASTTTFTNKSIAGSEVNSGTVPVAQIPTAIPIGSVGSAGLSGTAPAAIASSGAISVSYTNTTYFPFQSITTTGSSGAATLSGGVLNIPQYSGGSGPGTGTQYTHPYWSSTSTLGSVAPTTGYDGVPQVETNSTTAGAFTAAPVSAPQGVPVDIESGSTFTVALTDRYKVLNTTNATTSTAVTVPAPSTTGFGLNFVFAHLNSGSVVATDTPTTATVNGNSTMKLVGAVTGHNPEAAFWWEDSSTSCSSGPCYWGAEILPTDANGQLAAEGLNVANACPTCVVASSPGVGIAHFAGSTQTVTSSTIATADIAANAVTLAKLATQGANTVLANVTGSTAVPTAAAIPSGIQNYVAGTGYDQATAHQMAAPLACTGSASTTAPTCTTTPTFVPASGDCLNITWGATNSGALTLNVNASSAAPVQKWLGTALANGDAPTGKTVQTCYDGTNWQLGNIGNAPGGSAPALSAVTGSAAAATGTETAAGNAYTFAGVETTAAQYPIVFQNTNATNTATGALLVNTVGAGTGQVPLLVNMVTGGTAFQVTTGGTVTNGAISGSTVHLSYNTNADFLSVGSSSGGITAGTSGNQLTVQGNGQGVVIKSTLAAAGPNLITVPTAETGDIVDYQVNSVTQDGVGPTGILGNDGIQTVNGADYTNTTVTPSTVFSWTLPPTAATKTYAYTCDIMWESTAATLVGPVFGVNISAAPTQLTAAASVQNTLAGADINGYLSNTTTGSQTLVTSTAAGVTSTNYWAKIWGTIEGSPTAGATFIINAASTSGTTASLNIRRGSRCVLEATK